MTSFCCALLAAVSVFDYPALQPQHEAYKAQMLQSIRSSDALGMRMACMKAVEVFPEDPVRAALPDIIPKRDQVLLAQFHVRPPVAPSDRWLLFRRRCRFRSRIRRHRCRDVSVHAGRNTPMRPFRLAFFRMLHSVLAFARFSLVRQPGMAHLVRVLVLLKYAY